MARFIGIGEPKVISHFIGVGHYSRVGKDTLAEMISDGLGRQGVTSSVTSFASKLKDIAHQLYGWDGLRGEKFYNTPEGAPLRHVQLPNVGLTPTEIWVKLGTDAIRHNVYVDTWINCILKSKKLERVTIIPDVRFRNEAAAIRQAGGMLIKVIRPGYGPLDTEPDKALMDYLGWDMVVGMSGELSELQTVADTVSLWIAGKGPCPAMSIRQVKQALTFEKENLPKAPK